MTIWQQRMLAFAGVCLAGVAVQQVARRGEVTPESAASTLLDSLLKTDVDDVVDVYGSVAEMQPGLQVVLDQIDNGSRKDIEQTRYVVGMLQLERRLAKNDKALAKLAEGITQIKRQREQFAFDNHAITANLGSLYADIISPLGPRIQINGNPQHLKSTAVQQQVRALLLAGIRSAVLWRQLGGKRRQVIFNRRQMVKATVDLLKQQAS